MSISLTPMNFIKSAHFHLCHFVTDFPVLLNKAEGEISHDGGHIGDFLFSLTQGRNEKSRCEKGASVERVAAQNGCS